MIESLITGSNTPDVGEYKFDSSDHIRFQNGIDVSGHNNCHRQVEIKNNINGGEGYTVTIFNLDSNHPLWGNNIQMAPKQMKIVSHSEKVVSLRGFGHDIMGNDFSDYAIDIYFENKEIVKIALKLLDRNVELVYFK
ncbi:MAG: hypothetical protein IJ069_06265 [Prevotella sp.]|nr:hypothetical protein [Prevotella sp.]